MMTVDYPDRLGRSHELHLALGPGCLDESLTLAGCVRLRRWMVGVAGIAWVKRAHVVVAPEGPDPDAAL